MYIAEEKRVVSNAHSCFFAVVIIIIIAVIRIYNSSRSAQGSMLCAHQHMLRDVNTILLAERGVE